MKTDAGKSQKGQKLNLLITILRFCAITAAGIVCIILKKLTVDAAARLLTFFIVVELVIQACLLKGSRRIPHVLLFVLQSGLLSATALYCMNRPRMDLLVCLGITAFVAAFLLLFFPLLYRKKTISGIIGRDRNDTH